MTEERLKEIKDSIDFQKEILIAHNMATLCVDEELELYNEVVRLRKIINELKEWLDKEINNIKFNYSQINGNYFNMNYVIETYENVLDKIKELEEK